MSGCDVVSKLRIPHRRIDEILESSNMMSEGNRQRFTCHDHNAPVFCRKRRAVKNKQCTRDKKKTMRIHNVPTPLGRRP